MLAEPPVIPAPRPVATRALRSLAAGSAVALAARLSGVAISMTVVALLTRSLGPAGFGNLALGMTVTALAVQIADFGFSQNSVSHMAADPSRAAAVALAATALRVVGGCVAAAVIAGLATIGVFGEDAAALMLLLAMTIPLGGISSLSAVAQARLLPEVVGLMALTRVVSWALVVVVLAAIGAPLPAYAVGFVVVEVANALVSVAVAGRLCHLRGSDWRAEVWPLLRRSVPLGLMGLAVAVYYRIDTVLVHGLLGAGDAGLYALGYRVLDMVQILPQVLVVPLLPIVARLHSSRQTARARELFGHAVVGAVAVALPVMIGVPLMGSEIVPKVFGVEFAAASPALAVLALAFLPICLGWIGTSTAIATGGVGRLWLAAIVIACGSVAASSWFLPRQGLIAAAWTTVFAEVCMASVSLRQARHNLSASLPWRQLARVAWCGAVLLSVALVARRFGVVAAGVAGGTSYLVALWAFDVVPAQSFNQIRPMATEGSPT